MPLRLHARKGDPVIHIGVDPGITGAIVIYDSEKDLILHWTEMPSMQVGSSSRVNGAALTDFLEENIRTECVHAYVELVGAMPGQGVVSMFNFGCSFGVPLGVLAAMRIPYTLVTPQSWKRRASLMGKDKDVARSRAIQLWPSWRALSQKGTGQALADAALIARFGPEFSTHPPKQVTKRRRIAT
jgi:crossover junction endodeoxyribonuclease RuvC